MTGAALSVFFGLSNISKSNLGLIILDDPSQTLDPLFTQNLATLIGKRSEVMIKINKDKNNITSEGKLYISALIWEFRLTEPILNVLKTANAFNANSALSSEEISKRIIKEFVRINQFVVERVLKVLRALKILGKSVGGYYIL